MKALFFSFYDAIRDAASNWRYHSAFAIGWSFLIAVIVTVYFVSKGWAADASLWIITAFYFVGAFFGGYLALWLSHAFAERRTATARFSFFLVALAVLTLGVILLLFMLQHRIYFSQWHASFGTITWALQVFFTGLGSILLFLLTGLRPLLPWGVVALLVASIGFSRGWFSPRRR